MANVRALQFGVTVVPSADDLTAVVRATTTAESLGLDIVLLDPGETGADSRALAGWLAGTTDRMTLLVSLAPVPGQPPTMAGRAAASLDLLSSGRIQLLVGSDGTADEAGSTNGSLGAGEGLRETLDVVRGVMDTSLSGALRYHGETVDIPGAERGPSPRHRIPFVLRGADPARLQLIGQMADGWLLDPERLGLDDLRAVALAVDQAAESAGRDPSEIRRYALLGPASLTMEDVEGAIERLVALIVNLRVRTLLVRTDDEDLIRRFAQEIAPAITERIGRDHPEILTEKPVRPAAVRALRHAGIAYGDIPASLADIVIEPGDVGYDAVRSTYMRGGAPGLVLQPNDVDQVVEALRFARQHPFLPFAVRSGGHGISGRSTNHGGIVLDVSRLNTIEILDDARRLVRIGPGARWMDVAAALEPHGWALSSGDYGGVGVGGLATAGGVGFLARKHGLTIDHLRAAEMVLADGSHVRASDDENPDLFWAVRGAGANFGIVTAFEFEVDVVGNVGWAQLIFDASDTAGFLTRWGEAVERSPRDLTSFLTMGPTRPGRPTAAMIMTMIDADRPETIVEQLQPFAEVGALYDQKIYLTTYASVMANASPEGNNGEGEPVVRAGLIDHLTPEFTAEIDRLLRSGAVYFFQIRSVGGAVNDVEPTAMAYANRSANFSVSAFGFNAVRMDQLWEPLRPHFSGLYLSFESDQSPDRLNDAFPPATLARLRSLKRRYDPDNVLRDNFNIPPEAVMG